MIPYRAPLDDIRFVLKYQLNIFDNWPAFESLEDLDEETALAVLAEAAKLCEDEIAPLNREADEQPCTFNSGEVITPKGFKEGYQKFSEGGWGALSGNPDFGGMGMPKSLVSAIEEVLQGGSMSLGLVPMLTSGACLAINAHASMELKKLYLPKMYSGEWSGAMDLTEPHAGTDLGLIKTKATPLLDGSYSISGTKIFITWGEHDLTENIVHLVLAKLPDAPAGAKGISMFLVPKYIPEGPTLGERNSVHCGSLEKKMGIKASATCVMNFDGAKGWLIGPANKGLACMFTMMNYERLVVGVQAVGAAQHSLQSACHYAGERVQGRSLAGKKYKDRIADPLIVQPDVRRMLLTSRCFVEAGRAFYIYVANWLDTAKFSEDPSRKELAEERIALLTPIAKAFLSDTAFESALMCQQVLGGHGYIREWGLEQLVRDIRITQIYEGTNGIQAIDLISRKTVACEGCLFQSFYQEILEYMKAHIRVSENVASLEHALQCLKQATDCVLELAKSSPNATGAAAYDYLNLFGYVCYAYMWMRAEVGAHSLFEARNGEYAPEWLESKRLVAKVYFSRVLPICDTLLVRIKEGGDSLMALDDAMF